MNVSIYAAYRGDKYIGEGTLTELAKTLGVKRDTLFWYKTPSAMKCGDERDAKRKLYVEKPWIRLVLVEKRGR